MKLQKIVSRLQELHPKEIDLSLDRIQNLCKKLGNPQDKIKVISIVGTNGKYSTIQAMFAILKQADIKCNIYTSPHIKSINERFVFNNQELNDEELANLFEEILKKFFSLLKPLFSLLVVNVCKLLFARQRVSKATLDVLSVIVHQANCCKARLRSRLRYSAMRLRHLSHSR